MKKRALLASLLLVVAACNRGATQTNEAVKAGIVDHLNKGSGLDLSLMDLQVANVTFEGNTAKAMVTFRPKSAPDQGMQMNYTLEAKEGKWVVVGKAGSGSATGHGGGMGAQPPASGGEALPPGHPPVAPQDKSGQPK